jgi:colanic acid/amylovoran biosynthesis glycosyltransferase
VTGKDGDIEGIPVSIMEAMAVGLPVISTRHSAIPELVADGESGLLVAEHDVTGLTRAMASLGGDAALCERMGAAGRAIIEREFDAARLAERLEQLYVGLLQ